MKVENVTYSEPIIQRTLLGRKPANVLNDSAIATRDFVTLGEADAQSVQNTQSVWGDVPLKNADGTPQLRTVKADLDLTPRSPLKYGLIAAGIGAAVGAVTGWALFDKVGALAGGLGLAALAGGGAALAVNGDQVKVVWSTHQIVDHQLVGYHEYVGPGEKDGRRGYFHRFVPEVKETVLGTYQTPKAVHYK
ncbi:hypothetical protein IV102_28695 [bacterium]|nr:hypothetical protein [bacterium]